MRISADFAAPRRSSWKRRGAFLGAALALGGGFYAISRGGLERFKLFPASQPLPPQNPALEDRRNRSVAKALAKLDAKTIQAYFERYSNPEKTARNRAMRAIYIDAEILARRHPAWQLAGKLESGAIAPSSPQIARALASAGRGATDFSPATSPISAIPLEPREVAGTIVSDSAPSLSSASQSAALDRFLARSAARDDARARDEALLARQALDEATSRASRGTLPDLELPALPPDVALELLNLRLELLRNLSRTPIQRAATRERIRVIEARYAETLRAQMQAQSARQRAASIEAPERARREGLLRIERERQISAQSGARARSEVERDFEAILQRDGARNPALRLALPPFRALPDAPNRLAEAPNGSSSDDASQFFKTAGQTRASNARIENRVEGAGTRQKLAMQLRRQARLDAAKWARESAAVLGAKWSRDPKAPDETARALRLVFPPRQ